MAEEACGQAAPQTTEEQAAELSSRLAKHYGAGVQVQYVDVFSPQMQEHPTALRILNMGGYPLPFVAIDGKLMFAGGIELEAISAELEQAGVEPLGE